MNFDLIDQDKGPVDFEFGKCGLPSGLRSCLRNGRLKGRRVFIGGIFGVGSQCSHMTTREKLNLSKSPKLRGLP